MNNARLSLILLVLIALLFCLTFYFQVSGLLGLNRDGTNYFISIISQFRPTYYDSARRFAHYFSQLPFFSLLYLGIRDVKTLAYIYSANLFIIPLLPVLYFFWKSRNNENLLIIPILFLAYFCSFNSLFVISESVAAGSIYLLICGMIFYMRNDQSFIEKGFLLLLIVMTFRLYSSFILFIPMLMLLLKKKYDTQYRTYFFILFVLLGLSFLYNLYTTINYQYSSIPLNSILPDYSELIRGGKKLYYPMGVLVLVMTIVLAFFLEKTNDRKVKVCIYVTSAFLFFILIKLGIEYIPFFKFAYKNRLSNIYIPIFLSTFFFLPSRKFLASNLILVFTVMSLLLSVYLNAHFKFLNLLYYENMETKCSQHLGFDTAMPKNERAQFMTEFFSLIPDSILACAFAKKTVKTISYVPVFTNYYPFDIHKRDAYPDLSLYGVKYEIKNFKTEVESR